MLARNLDFRGPSGSPRQIVAFIWGKFIRENYSAEILFDKLLEI